MATPIRKIRVMLSSRNRDRIPDADGAVPLETVRRVLQTELQDEQFCGYGLLEVWINEEAGAEDGTGDAWDQCMAQIDRADIVVAIYNGNAGWTHDPGGIGICHAELERAWSKAPARVRLVALDFSSDRRRGLRGPDDVAQEGAPNQAFKRYLSQLNLFRSNAVDAASLRDAVRLAVVKGVADLAATGSREARKGKYHLGSPLDWSRLSYDDRKIQIEAVVTHYLQASRGGIVTPGGVVLTVEGASLLLCVHGVPAGFGVTEAREKVGRAYLSDHRTSVVASGSNIIGPVHVIACHKSCTESQVVSFMGHPDLFSVSPPFGFFVADQIGFVQAFFLTNCRDETATLLACQRMFDWIEQSGEQARLLARACSRAQIMRATAAELAKAPPAAGGIAAAPPPRVRAGNRTRPARTNG